MSLQLHYTRVQPKTNICTCFSGGITSTKAEEQKANQRNPVEKNLSKSRTNSTPNKPEQNLLHHTLNHLSSLEGQSEDKNLPFSF